MPASDVWLAQEPTREAVDAMPGLVLLEFGAPWCGHCIAARPLVEQVLHDRDDIRHLRIEDGRGRRLGRSFAVKLWPTFVLLRDGVDYGRRVRPTRMSELAALLAEAADDDSPRDAASSPAWRGAPGPGASAFDA